MKKHAAALFVLCTLLAPLSIAQRGRPPVASAPAPPVHNGMRPNSGFEGEGSRFLLRREHDGLRSGYAGFQSAYPSSGFYDDRVGDLDTSSHGNPAAPIILMVPPPPPPPPPPDPPRPVLHEYSWPASSVRDTPSTYTLVLADSTVQLAVAVWQQEGSLHYLDPDGTSRTLSLNKLDRSATRRLNAERGLNFPLLAAL